MRFGLMKALQKFASVQSNIHNPLNQERHLIDHQTTLGRARRVKEPQKPRPRQSGKRCSWNDSTHAGNPVI